MLQLGALGFTSPFVLLALLALPLLWFLLKLTPPQPRRVLFPPLRLLLELKGTPESAANTPWWLLLIRLVLMCLLIVALAGPVWQPARDLIPTKARQIAIILDTGWASGAIWTRQITSLQTLLDEAEQKNLPVLLITDQEGEIGPVQMDAANRVRERLAALAPQSWPTSDTFLRDRVRASLTPLQKPTALYWLSAGLDRPALRTELAKQSRTKPITGLTLFMPDQALPRVRSVTHDKGTLQILISRIPISADTNAKELLPLSAHQLRLYDRQGRLLAEQPTAFAAGKTENTITLDLPLRLINDIRTLSLSPALGVDRTHLDRQARQHAGLYYFLDDQWTIRRAGFLVGADEKTVQPLLSPRHYLHKALANHVSLLQPRAQALDQAIEGLINRKASLIGLSDIGVLPLETEERLLAWVKAGGVLVRFAGPRMAKQADTLLPVALRQGSRHLGGALSWDVPQKLGSFTKGSPLDGLPVPQDVRVRQQVLADPTETPPQTIWARLEDGTPLITGLQEGAGWLVLVHVTAETSWSNLPLSGVYVDILKRLVALSPANPPVLKTAQAPAGAATDDDGALGGGTDEGAALQAEQGQRPSQAMVLNAQRIVDGHGRIVPAGTAFKPVENGPRPLFSAPRTPPGHYGLGTARRAVNLLPGKADLKPLIMQDHAGMQQIAYHLSAPRALRPLLLLLAALLLCLDALLVALSLGGRGLSGFSLKKIAGRASVLVLAPAFVLLLPDLAVRAQSSETRALDALRQIRFAYVITGDAATDRLSFQGLDGLSRVLNARTSIEPGKPHGVDPAKDDLSFYPLVYWPITPERPAPSFKAMGRIDAYMKQGGTVIFDTRDQARQDFGQATTPANLRLRQMMQRLNIPPLSPVPADHVLKKSFYLVEQFPGRWTDGTLWIAGVARQNGQGSGSADAAQHALSSILITSNDFASAWAVDDQGRPVRATIPATRQARELSYRAGVNLVMYILTGNYKADQVHIPAILERLGQ